MKLSELIKAAISEIDLINKKIESMFEEIDVGAADQFYLKDYSRSFFICQKLKRQLTQENAPLDLVNLACQLLLAQLHTLRTSAYFLIHDIRSPTLNLYIEHLVEERKKQILLWLDLEDVEKNRQLKIYGDSTCTILEEICTGFPELIPVALEIGCDPNVKAEGGFGNTPLTWAIANNSKKSVIVLIEECKKQLIKIDLDKESAFNGNTPLILTIAKGHKNENEMSNFELTKFLLEQGANPNKADCCGYTPLHYAFLRRDLDTIQLLMQYGANLYVINNQNETPSDILKWNYKESKDKVFAITNGNDQGSCSFCKQKEFEENTLYCQDFQLKLLEEQRKNPKEELKEHGFFTQSNDPTSKTRVAADFSMPGSGKKDPFCSTAERSQIMSKIATDTADPNVKIKEAEDKINNSIKKPSK